MTPAEMKTLRESLGLSAQFLSDNLNVQLRTVQYWESGKKPVPKDVSDWLQNISNNFDRMLKQQTDALELLFVSHGQPAEIVLIRYRTQEHLWRFLPEFHPFPETTHTAMLVRLWTWLKERDIPVKITYMNPDQYVMWLNGREDSTDLRAAWAGEQDNHNAASNVEATKEP